MFLEKRVLKSERLPNFSKFTFFALISAEVDDNHINISDEGSEVDISHCHVPWIWMMITMTMTYFERSKISYFRLAN